jgi:hypothetical protein
MLSDRSVIRWRRRRGGVWVPEDRLRAALFGAATFVPLSIVLCGLITHYVEGTLGLVLNLVCFFFNGLGVDLVLSPSSAYMVDVMHSRSSEMMAASVCVVPLLRLCKGLTCKNRGLRSLLLSLAVSGILPSIKYFGLVATNTVVGLLAWGGFVQVVDINFVGNRSDFPC